jgi:hypothetical protein
MFLHLTINNTAIRTGARFYGGRRSGGVERSKLETTPFDEYAKRSAHVQFTREVDGGQHSRVRVTTRHGEVCAMFWPLGKPADVRLCRIDREQRMLLKERAIYYGW